ncbi:MAG: 2OG-Fe(II) oxygenase [Steroidobacteraceae bacterium]|nr:2OG-Fe(II) oxygenase [Steroidobacteraceae bacterium]
MSSPVPPVVLRSRALAGDLDALAQLGRRLLLGEGVAAAPQEGLACLRSAAARGHAEAESQLALLAAFGVLQARSIPAALAHLRRAAALGREQARRELTLLSRGGIDVNVAALTTPPAVRPVTGSARIRVFERFATAGECAWLIDSARASLRRAQVYRRDEEGYTEADSRTNREADFVFDNASVVLSLVRERIAAAAGIAADHFEIAKLLHYEPGQQFAPHGDFQETTSPALAREVERRGQRIATFLVYLNDDYDGGETDFPRLGFRYKGARGDALLFFNVDAAGRPDYDTVHAGLPTTRGEKWLLSQWMRSKPVG